MGGTLRLFRMPAVGTLILGAICISFAAIFVKLLGSGLMGPTAIGFWRTLLGSGLLFVIALMQRRSLRMSGPAFGWSALAGFIFFLDLFIWHRSILFAGAGMATILANTQVFGTAVLSFFVFRERLKPLFYISAVVAVAGVTMLVGVGSDLEFTDRYLNGIALGLLTGVVYGGYLVTLKAAGRAGRVADPVVFTAWAALFSAVCLGLVGAVEADAFWPPSVYALGVLVALALVVQALGWWAIVWSLPHLEVAKSGLILLLQPVLATVWGVLFFLERLNLVQILGAAVTLVAIYVGYVFGGGRVTARREEV